VSHTVPRLTESPRQQKASTSRTHKEFFITRLRSTNCPPPPLGISNILPRPTMSFDMDWSPDFCLACDRQTDGNVYCSEACKLAEYEKSSNAGSTASSPSSPSGFSWPTTKPSNNGFYMEPAYNFKNAKPYGTSPSSRNSHFYQPYSPQSSPVTFNVKPVLTPSSSQSSLFSMRSTTSSTTAEPIQLSDEARKALRAYASSFDQSRYSRRQST
jgi:hypothetical protein